MSRALTGSRRAARPRRRAWLDWVVVPIVLWTTGLARFWEYLGGFFVRDDFKYLSWGHELVRRGSWAAVADHVTRPQDRGFRPLPRLTSIWDTLCWPLDPLGWHCTTVLFHLLSALVVYRLGLRLFRSRAAGFSASLLFVIHPFAGEIVAWIALREEGMLGLASLLSLACYLRARSGSKTSVSWLALSWGAALLAVFCKETAVVLPAVIVLAEALVPGLGRASSLRWLAFLPHACAVALGLWAKMEVHGTLIGGVTGPGQVPILSVWRYLGDLGPSLRVVLLDFPRMMLIPLLPGSGGTGSIAGAIVPGLAFGVLLCRWRTRTVLLPLAFVVTAAFALILPVVPDLARWSIEDAQIRRFYYPTPFAALAIGALLLAPPDRLTRSGHRWVPRSVAGLLLLPILLVYWRGFGEVASAHHVTALELEKLAKELEARTARLVDGSRLHYFGNAASKPADLTTWLSLRRRTRYFAVALEDGTRVAFQPRDLDWGFDWRPDYPVDALQWDVRDHLFYWSHERQVLEDWTGAMEAAVERRFLSAGEGARYWGRWGRPWSEWRLEGAGEIEEGSEGGLRIDGVLRLHHPCVEAEPWAHDGLLLVLAEAVDESNDWRVTIRWSPAFQGDRQIAGNAVAHLRTRQTELLLPVGHFPQWLLLPEITDLFLEFEPLGENGSPLRLAEIELAAAGSLDDSDLE